MKQLAFLLTLLLLPGCAALEAKIENVPVCSMLRDRAFLLSMYGPFGLSSEVAPRYVSAMCPLIGYPIQK